MRTLQECQAEIFRRSEKRIRQRRFRRISIGAMFVLCFLITGVLIRPSDDTATDLVGGLTMETAMYSENPMTEVRVSGPQLSLRCTDPEDILQIRDLVETPALYSIPEKEPAATQETSREIIDGEVIDRNYATGGLGADVAAAVYTLTFVYQDGTTQVYTLAGNTLTDANGHVCFLAQADADTLWELLNGSAP